MVNMTMRMRIETVCKCFEHSNENMKWTPITKLLAQKYCVDSRKML